MSKIAICLSLGCGDIVVLIVTFEDIVNKSANGLGGNKSGNSVQGENPPVCI